MSDDNENLSITLYSDRAARFREIRSVLTDKMGYEPPRPETLGIMMAQWNGETFLEGL